MDEGLLKRAEELLGKPLPPKESPQFLEVLAELARKDAALAKALMAAAKGAVVPKEVATGVEKKVKGALQAAERQARLRDAFKKVYERFFVRPTSVGGRKVKVPVKGAWIMVILLALGGGLAFLWFAMQAPQQNAQAVAKLPVGASPEATAEELRGEAEKVLGKPLPKPGEPGYEEALQELQRTNPALAQAIRDKERSALLEAQANSAAEKASEGIMGKMRDVQNAQAAAEQASQPPDSLPPQGEAVPPPPVATPPPTVPPPPGASGSSGTTEVLPYTMQERTLRPLLSEQGQAEAAQGSGQGDQGGGQDGGPRRRGPFFLEGKGPSSPLTGEKDRNRTASLAENQGGNRGQGLLLTEARGGDGAGVVVGAPLGNTPFGPPAASPGGSPSRAGSSPVFVERISNGSGENKGVGWRVLAEAQDLSSRASSQNPSAGLGQEASPNLSAPPSGSFQAPSSGGFVQEPGNALTPPQGFAQGQGLPTPAGPNTGGPPPPPPASSSSSQQGYPYQPGKTLTARLNVKLAVVEGSESPAVLEGADGSIWVGKAKLGTLARVQIELDTLYLQGRSYRVRAYVYDQDRQLGVAARVQEQSPSLAQDVLRASAAALGQYVDLLSKQTQVTQLPGGGVVQSQQAPPLEMVVLGNIGRLFALPEDRKSLVRVAEVEAGKVVQVMVMGFE